MLKKSTEPTEDSKSPRSLVHVQCMPNQYAIWAGSRGTCTWHAFTFCHALFRHLNRRVDSELELAMASSSASAVESFTVEVFGSFISDKNVDKEVTGSFGRNKVSGAVFLILTERDINELVPSVRLRPQIRSILKDSNKVDILD